MSRLLLSASLLAITSTTVATAQSPGLHDHDDIIVTGTLLDRSADEVVTNVTALDREEIVRDLRTTLGDTLDREPGVSTTFFGAGASRPVLRGLGSERVLVLTNGIGVIDVSAASPDHQVTADGIDAERIEILRGASALAYGGQAIGGVVNVIDGLIADDLPDMGVDAFAAYNSAFDGIEGAVQARGSLGPLALAASYSRRDFEDYEIPGGIESDVLLAFEGEAAEDSETGTLPNSFVETETLSGGASLVFDGGHIGISVRQTDALYGLPGGHEHEGEGEAGAEAEEEEENPFIDLEQTRIDIAGAVELGDGFFKQLRASGIIADYDHTEFEAPGEAGTIYAREGVEGRVELRTGIDANDGGLLSGVVGAQFLDNEFVAVGEEAFITPTDTQSAAVFIFQSYKSDENIVSFDIGARGETVEYDNILAGERDFDLLSASIAGHFHPTEEIFAGIEVAYTERAPNESELFSNGAHLATRQFEIGNTEFQKESGTNIELTARYDTGALRIGGNVFLTNFDNFISLLPSVPLAEEDGFPVFNFTQTGADFKGGEIYAEATVDAGLAELDLSASVDYVDAELKGGQFDGANVPLLPPVTFNADVAADFGLITATAALTVAADQDDAGPGPEQLPTDGYTNLDLGLSAGLDSFGFGGDGTEIFAQVRNVLDEEIRYSTSTLRDFAPAPGRNFRAGVRVSF